MTAPRTLVFATRNHGKVAELRELCADLPLRVLAIDEVGREVAEVEEDGDTFAANAAKKAREVTRAVGLPALADDSGLEVDALGGAPGVQSARYAVSRGVAAAAGAGRQEIDDANNRLLLEALAAVPAEGRTARFRSVLALADAAGPLGDQVLLAEGACEGRILEAPRGTGGFGYDPLFFSPELGATFAEMGVGPKNQLSHRARAMRGMRPLLVEYFRLASRAWS